VALEDEMAAPEVDYSKAAGDIKSQIVHLTALLLDIPEEHAARANLADARSDLEKAYQKLREAIVPTPMVLERRR
jgi:hypothetical protein